MKSLRLLATLLLLGCPTHAAILTVTTTADTGTGSLRSTITRAFTGDTIRFADNVRGIIPLATGPITSLTPKDLTIEGPGYDLLAISGTKTGRLLDLPGNLTISGLTFTKAAHGYALTLDAGQSGSGSVKNCRFTQNSGTGALHLYDGTWQIDDCIFTNNTSTGKPLDLSLTGSLETIGAPALLVAYRADAHVNRCLFTGNQAANASGGAIATGGTLTAIDCTLSSNAARHGGAVYAKGGTATFQRCTFHTNYSSKRGGAIAQNGATVSLDTCTLYGNTAIVGGGLSAISQLHDTTYLTACTLTKNHALSGGGLFATSLVIILKNNLIAGNKASNSGPDVQAFVISQDGNLIGKSQGATANPWGYADQLGTNASPIDPKLSPLADHGGPTATVAPLPGSPAIDGGVSISGGPTTDQTGAPRVIDSGTLQNAPGGDGRDIGAYELPAP